MLVLRRKVNQSILIGDSIRVVVVGVDGHHVKIGIEAPSDVAVYRSEIVPLDAAVGGQADGGERREG